MLVGGVPFGSEVPRHRASAACPSWLRQTASIEAPINVSPGQEQQGTSKEFTATCLSIQALADTLLHVLPPSRSR